MSIQCATFGGQFNSLYTFWFISSLLNFLPKDIASRMFIFSIIYKEQDIGNHLSIYHSDVLNLVCTYVII